MSKQLSKGGYGAVWKENLLTDTEAFAKAWKIWGEARERSPQDKFVLSGTAQMFNLSFDLSWKVMKDIIREFHGVPEYPTGSPRETLRIAHSVGLIEDDLWVEMLRVRNNLAHDYDGELALKYFQDILQKYEGLMRCFCERASEYYEY